MASAHEHRFIIVAANARVNAVVNWLNSNWGSGSVPANLGPGLSASGIAPATHRWCNVSATNPQARDLVIQMCNLASVAPPTVNQWNGWTGAERRAFWNGVRQTVQNNFGVWVQLADNLGQWDSPDECLLARGLKVIVSV